MQFKRGMGVTLSSVSSTRRQTGAESLLLDSGAQLHARPIKYPGQKYRWLILHTTSGARLQHDGGRLVTYKLPEGLTIRVLFHACAVQKPIVFLGCLAQQEYWSDLRADIGTLFFPDMIQTNHSQSQLHKEESLFFLSKRHTACTDAHSVSAHTLNSMITRQHANTRGSRAHSSGLRIGVSK